LVEKILAKDPPYGAQVEAKFERGGTGWNAPALAPWLEKSVTQASEMAFGKPARADGEGGSIPFMGMLGEKFPETQFVITGVLGPHSNAHGPNEFLHVPTGKKITMAIAQMRRRPPHAQASLIESGLRRRLTSARRFFVSMRRSRRSARRPGSAARCRPHGGFLKQCDQALKRIGAVALLRAMALRNEHNDTVLG